MSERRVHACAIVQSTACDIVVVLNCRTAIAIRGKDGVVFAVEKLITSKLHERSVNRRICTIDRHVGVVSTLD